MAINSLARWSSWWSRNKSEDENIKYRTKIVNFFGRSVPILLQNSNGPCPLIAICNVLLLRNEIDLDPDDASDVSEKELLFLLEGKLTFSSKGHQVKDIAEAIDLLPRLSSGINVDVQFTRIDGFEFTHGWNIFDLLDIDLYHGWIIDPEDADTAAAIGSKFYNRLLAELIAYKTANSEYDGAVTVNKRRGKGDTEEELDLERILKISRTVTHISDTLPYSDFDCGCTSSSCSSLFEDPATISDASSVSGSAVQDDSVILQKGNEESDQCKPLELLELRESIDSRDISIDLLAKRYTLHPEFSGNDAIVQPSKTLVRTNSDGGTGYPIASDSVQSGSIDPSLQNQDQLLFRIYRDLSIKDQTSQQDESATHAGDITSQIQSMPNIALRNCNLTSLSTTTTSSADKNFNGKRQLLDNFGGAYLILGGNETIHGEDRLVDHTLPKSGDTEKVFDQEGDILTAHSNNEDFQQKCHLIENFLSKNASQLTLYGLRCLQDDLQEKELCILFRNNHFSTMLKFNGELYLLVTDQGYLNQSDLVWEKLNEVNGNTVFVTGSFEKFKVVDQDNINSNEETAEFQSAMEVSEPENDCLDFLLAQALQELEFDGMTQRSHLSSSDYLSHDI